MHRQASRAGRRRRRSTTEVARQGAASWGSTGRREGEGRSDRTACPTAARNARRSVGTCIPTVWAGDSWEGGQSSEDNALAQMRMAGGFSVTRVEGRGPRDGANRLDGIGGMCRGIAFQS